MEPVTFCSDLSLFAGQFSAIRTAIYGEGSLPVVHAALEALSLKQEYLRDSPRYFECVRKLEVTNPSWIAIEFLKSTPPAHLGMDKLKRLFDLAARVYVATNELLGSHAKPDQSQELATWLYDILKHIELLEAKQKALASTAKSLVVGTITAVASAAINPLLAIGSIPITYLTKWFTTSETTVPERRWIKPLEYINLCYVLRYMFEPESSGLYGRHIKGVQSYTIGELEIDLGRDAFSCFFNLNNKHKISPMDVCRLSIAMLKNLKNQTGNPEIYLEIISHLETTHIPRGNGYPETCAFLDPELALGLAHIKKCCQALVSTSKPHSHTPVTGKIVDVSGYKNGCGLYALTVASLRAHRSAKASHKASIPEYLLECEEKWLTSFNLKIIQLHSMLRDNMANALLENAQYQEDSKITFTSTCLSMLEGELCPAEMSSFFQSNEPFWSELSQIPTNLPYKLTTDEAAEYSKRIQGALKAKDIASMQKAIQEHFRSPNPPKSFQDIIDDFFTDTKDPLARIIQQRKLFLLTCTSCPTQEMRNRWKEEAEKWLEHALLELVQTTPQLQNLSLIKFFGFLSCANFEGLGEVFTLPTNTDCMDTATLRLLIDGRVREQWPQLFANYVEYVRTQDCMLSTFELHALAKVWNIGLSILEWNHTNETLGPPQPGELRVCLTNPSKRHWQAYVVK